MMSVIVMTFWYVFGTDLTFFELFELYFHLGLITTPHVLYVHMTYVYSFSLCFILHTMLWPREVIRRIMIFSTSEYILFYGRLPTLIFFFLLREPTTPILPVYVVQRRPHLEKDTTRTRGMVIRQLPTVPGRTSFGPH